MPDPERMTSVVQGWVVVQKAGLRSRLVLETRGLGQFTYFFPLILEPSRSY
jgi:hypothetical protein